MVLRLAFKPLFTHSLSGFDRLVEFNSVGSSYRNGHETGSASRACIKATPSLLYIHPSRKRHTLLAIVRDTEASHLWSLRCLFVFPYSS